MQFSLAYHNEASFEQREDYVPDVTHNLMATKESIYGEILNLLTKHFSLEKIGIAPNASVKERMRAVARFTQRLPSGYLTQHEIDTLENFEQAMDGLTGQLFTLDLPCWGPKFVATDIKKFIDLQVDYTGRGCPDDVIVLANDRDVKKFLETGGASLLKKIKFTGALGIHEENYRDGFLDTAHEFFYRGK